MASALAERERERERDRGREKDRKRKVQGCEGVKMKIVLKNTKHQAPLPERYTRNHEHLSCGVFDTRCNLL